MICTPFDMFKFLKSPFIFKSNYTTCLTFAKTNIPFRIIRSDTDLLKAISATVQHDSLAPSFKFQDDPYFIPINLSEKRNFVLSEQSGRMAAQYFLNKYPKLFEEYSDEPNVKQFYSKNLNLDKLLAEPLSPARLFELIKVEAPFNYIYTVYDKLKKEGLLCVKSHLACLQLFAFYNSTDPKETISHVDQLSIQNCKLQTLENKDFRVENEVTPPHLASEVVEPYQNIKKNEVNLLSPDTEKLTTKALLGNVNQGIANAEWETPGASMYWHRLSGLQASSQRWKNIGLANRIWSENETKTLEVYTVMIKAFAKYMNAEKAFTLYDEMKLNNVAINREIYNSLIQLLPYKHDNPEVQWDFTMKLIKEMSETNINPNYTTFINILAILPNFKNYKQASTLCLQTLNEMKICGIEPSLTVFYYILKCHYKDRRSYNTIIYDVIKFMQHKSFIITHTLDVEFFHIAMQMVCNNTQDPILADQLIKIYEHGNNKIMIGNEKNHYIFFYHYFLCLLRFANLDKVVQAYEKYVPNEFCLDFRLAHEFLHSLIHKLQSEFRSPSSIINDSNPENLIDNLDILSSMKKDTIPKSSFKDIATMSDWLVRLWSDFQVFGLIIPRETFKERFERSHERNADLNTSNSNTYGYEKENDMYKKFLIGIRECLTHLNMHKRILASNEAINKVDSITTEINLDRINKLMLELLKVATDINARLDDMIKIRFRKEKVYDSHKSEITSNSSNIKLRIINFAENKYSPFIDDFVKIYYEAGFDKGLWNLIKTFQTSALFAEVSPKILMVCLEKAALVDRNFENALLCLKIYTRCRFPEARLIASKYFGLSELNPVLQNAEPTLPTITNYALDPTQKTMVENILNEYETAITTSPISPLHFKAY